MLYLHSRIRSAVLGALLLVVPAIGASALAGEPYRLQPGDTVSFAVAAIPALDRELKVSPEGEINVPLIGWNSVAGRTVREVEQSLREALSEAVYRQRQDGDELLLAIRAEEVSLEVAQYRPIYVNGSVASPGKKDFLPGITVRQAIAVSGGSKFEVVPPGDDRRRRLVDLEAEYDVAMASYVAALTKLARLTAETTGADIVPPEGFATGPYLPAETVKSITDDAQALLAAESARTRDEQAYLTGAIKQNAQRVAVLREQHGQEQTGATDDVAELARIQQLERQGSVQLARLTDARRQSLLSSTRALETKAELATAELRQADLERQLQRLDQDKRVADLSDLQDASRDAARLRAELQGKAQAIALALEATPELAAPPPLTFAIYRMGIPPITGGLQDLDTELQPADVVEISGAPASQPGGDYAAQ